VNLSNCSRCGRVFARPPGGSEICPACVKENDDNYRKIFEFFAKKPTATAQEIADETGIDLKEIYRYVRENRLKLVFSDGAMTCESCGTPIPAGKICEDCRMKLAQELKKNLEKHRQERPKTDNLRNSITRNPKYLKDRRGDK
jgi:flagellar operon protein (TIGR03826 family)